MAIGFRTSSSAATSTIGLPLGTQVGDILIAGVTGATNVTTTFTWPTGWTVLGNANGQSSALFFNMEIGWFLYTGTGSSWAVTNASSNVCGAYSGVAVSDPFADQQISAVTNVVTTVTTPTLTNGSAQNWRVGIYGNDALSSIAWSSYSPSDTERVEVQQGARYDIAIADSAAPIATGSTSVTATAASSVRNAAAWIGLLQPAQSPFVRMTTANIRSSFY